MPATDSKRKRIAVVTELEWPMRRHYELVGGVEDYAHKHANWDIDVTRFPDVQLRAGAHFDGIVGRIEPSILRVATQSKIPIVNVLVSSNIKHRMPSVLVDCEGGGRMAAEHMIKRGMPRLISMQCGHKHEMHTRGLLEAAKENGVETRILRVATQLDGDRASWRHIYNSLRTITKEWAPPIGILTSYDAGARIIMTIMKDFGWVAPHDYIIVGTGNEEALCVSTHPTLSSVDLGNRRNGYEAADMLAKLMEGQKPPEHALTTRLRGLMVRASSDVYAARDPEVQTALTFLSNNSHLPIQVNDVTAATNIGRQMLERRFRAELNTSIYAELHRLRISRVKRQLVEQPDATIKEIGMNSGFSTLCNFFAAFKKDTGMTPEHYRNEHADPIKW